MQKITVKIDGMACSMCESHINDQIRKNFSVKKVKSSHKTGETVIISEDINNEALKKAIDETGYSVISIEKVTYCKKRFGMF